MKNKSHQDKLQNLIRLVEARKEKEWLEIKLGVANLGDQLKPSHFLATAAGEFSRPEFREKLIGSGLSLLVGYLSRKWIVGESDNPFRKMLGFLAQALVSRTMAHKW